MLTAAACRSAEKTAAADGEPAKEEAKEESEDVVTLSEEEVKASGIVATVVAEGQIAETVSIQGRVVPRSGGQAQVFSPFPGRLSAPRAGLPILGRAVQQGQTLAVVEQELSATEATAAAEKRIEIDSQIQQAESQVEQKTRDYERAKALYDGGVIALKQLQLAETDLRIARAQLAAAQRAKASYDALLRAGAAGSRRIEITAPISGVITAVNAAVNQQVSADKPLFEITQLGLVWIEAQVFEDYLPLVRRARTLEITSRAAPDTIFIGRIVSFTHQVDPANKTEGVIFEVANKNDVLAVGMNVDVRVPSGEASTGLTVAASAIIEEEGHSIVFVELEPGRYEKREVKTGARDSKSVIITDGLKAGEKVVTTGAQLLAAGKEEGEEEEK
jgi:cobalt-zinc-cadmium efflux system membrane fusion protein